MYKLSKPAAKDIENILQYTLEKWGQLQFERYYHLIDTTLNIIGYHPDCSQCRSRDELFPGCRSRSFGKHVVFYRIANGEVEIVRILHQMMDHSRHLP
ncbi:MAG: type II toxin-antitoxin system RelE/ParE family toxin [Bacteroidia bacterium]